MKVTVLACALCVLMFAGCSSEANLVGGSSTGSGIDFANPESVFAAYAAATHTGDDDAIRRLLLPSQRETFTGAIGGGSATYKIVRREDTSPSEVRLYVKVDDIDEVLPHVLVREEGMWYIDIDKTGWMIYEAMGG